LTAAIPRGRSGPWRILVVEDDFLVGLQLEEDLRAAGHAVLGPCGSLQQALEVSRGGLFDLAILDVNLRGHTVFPLAEELAERGLPLILLTGYQSADLPDRWRDRPHLTKPYDLDRLAATIAHVLG